jgi:hypothetical protein
MAHAFTFRLEDPRVHAYAPRYCFLHGPDSALNARLREAVIAAKRELPEEQDAGRIELVSTNEQRAIESVLLETLIVLPSLGIAVSASFTDLAGSSPRPAPRSHQLLLRAVDRSRAVLWVAGFASVMSLPAMATGLAADDYVIEAAVEHDPVPLPPVGSRLQLPVTPAFP